MRANTLGVLAVLVLVTGCRPGHNADSAATIRKLEERITVLEQRRQSEDRALGAPDPNATVTERVARLEGIAARYSDALQFLLVVYEQQKKQQDEEEANEHDPEAMFAVDIGKPVKAGQVEGPATASVTIVKAFDFACPHCQRMSEPLHDVVNEYKGKVRVVYMNLVVHPDQVQVAHQYSCAAAKQKKYLAWKTAFWDKAYAAYASSGGRDTAAMQEPNILVFSKTLGLDVAKLEADAKSEACKKRIDEDQAEMTKFKVSGTPALFVNGTFVGGAIPKEALKKLVDEKLALVEKSGVPGAQYYDKVVMAKGVKQFRSKKDAKP